MSNPHQPLGRIHFQPGAAAGEEKNGHRDERQIIIAVPSYELLKIPSIRASRLARRAKAVDALRRDRNPGNYEFFNSEATHVTAVIEERPHHVYIHPDAQSTAGANPPPSAAQFAGRLMIAHRGPMLPAPVCGTERTGPHRSWRRQCLHDDYLQGQTARSGNSPPIRWRSPARSHPW